MLTRILTSPRPNYKYSAAAPRLRVYANRSFVTLSGKKIEAGDFKGKNWYLEILCSFDVDGNLLVPDFYLESTTDSSDADATYTAYLFVGKTRINQPFFQNLSVTTALGATADLNRLEELSQIAANKSPFDRASVIDYIERSIATVAGITTMNATTLLSFTPSQLLNRANHTGTQTASTISDFAPAARNTSLTGFGAGANADVTALDTILSAIAKLNNRSAANKTAIEASATNLPTNVRATTLNGLGAGSNSAVAPSDTVLAAIAKIQAQITANAAAGLGGAWAQITGKPVKYASEYASLNAAITAINIAGTPKTDLQIDADIVFTGTTLTVPTNIRIRAGNGRITSGNGQTLTVSNQQPAGNQQLFYCTGATKGKVVYALGAIDVINLAAWLGMDLSLDATSAINDFCASLANNFGGRGYIPGLRRTTGNHTIPANAWIYSDGRDSGVLCTAANVSVFKVAAITGAVYSGLKLENMKIDGGSLANVKCLNVSGSTGQAIFRMSFNKVSFVNASVGANLVNNSGQQTEIENAVFNECDFFNVNKGFYGDVINGSIHFESCNFTLPPGANTCIDIVSCGVFSSNKHLATGTNLNVGAPTDGSCFLRVTSQHSPIRITGGQDEGLEYFFQTGGNNFLQGLIYLSGNAVQGKIKFKYGGSTQIYSNGNQYNSDLFVDEVGAYGIVHSKHDVIIPVLYDNSPTATPRLTPGFVGNSYISEEHLLSPFPNKAFRRHPQEFSLAPITRGTVATSPAFINGNQPVIKISGTETYPFLQMGDFNGTDFYGWSFARNNLTGALEIEGNQVGYRDVNFKNGSLLTNGVAVAGILSATATLDFPLVAATGGTSDLTVTVAGAAIGDVCYAAPAATLETGLCIAAVFVSAANTVTIRLANVTAAAIDPASKSWKVKVIK